MDLATAKQRAKQFGRLTYRVVTWAKETGRSDIYGVYRTHSDFPVDGVDTIGDAVDTDYPRRPGRNFRALFIAANNAGLFTQAERDAIQAFIQSGGKQRMRVVDRISPDEHWFEIWFEFRNSNMPAGVYYRVIIDSRGIGPDATIPDGITYEQLSIQGDQ